MAKGGKAVEKEPDCNRVILRLENDLVVEIDAYRTQMAPGVSLPRSQAMRALLRRGLDAEKKRLKLG